EGITVFGIHLPREVKLAPGKEVDLYELNLKLRGPSTIPKAVGPDMLVGISGKVGIQYERVFGNSSSGSIKIDPRLSKLGTGKMELEIKSDPPPGIEQKSPKKQPTEKVADQEAVTGKSDAEAPKKAAPKTDEEKLQGAWKLVRMEAGGQVASEEETSLGPELVFDGNRIENDKGKQPAPFPRGAFTLDTTNNPKNITIITDFDGARYPSKGVYELDGDDLKICIDFNHVGKRNYEAATELKTKAGSLLLLYSFKRQKANKEAFTAWGKE